MPMRVACWFGVLVLGGLAQVASAQGIGAMGQQQQTLGANQSVMAVMLDPTTGSPYQAMKVTTSVQKLGDGTVITHETKGLFARDAEGRVREDLYLVHSGQMGGREHDTALQSVTVGDPVAHTMLIWTDPKAKIAMKMALPDLGGKSSHGLSPLMAALAAAPPPPPPVGAASLGTADPAAPAKVLRMQSKEAAQRDDVRTEQLGQQSMEGVLATGVRTTTAIPLGKVGNDRPMTVVHEEWRSPELKILVKTFDSDPRTGEQTMELTQLVRTDPDKALFDAPTGFKVMEMGDMMKMLGDLGKTK